VKNRRNQARAIGTTPDEYLRALGYRLRMPPTPLNHVTTGPVQEVILKGDDVDLGQLPLHRHKQVDTRPYISSANLIRDPETGFYNSCHAGITVAGKNTGHISFVTAHSNMIIRKYLDRGETKMPVALMVGVPPAYEIMANYSGLHMDMWGEIDMVGTLMGKPIDMIPAKTVDLMVPAHAEMIIEGYATLEYSEMSDTVTSPSKYNLPQSEKVREFNITAITMREDRPIWRSHQTCPDTDHQTLPRLCHEAILYNRLTEMGLTVKDVRFPTWGGALSCVIQFDYRHDGFVNDALMMVMGAPWLNTKMVVAISPDTNIESAQDVYHAIATRCDPETDMFTVGHTRGSLYDPSARPLPPEFHPFRLGGKLGIDATIKSRHDPKDFERAYPLHWGELSLTDFL
jgi:UbiD family decarboxylase